MRQVRSAFIVYDSGQPLLGRLSGPLLPRQTSKPPPKLPLSKNAPRADISIVTSEPKKYRLLTRSDFDGLVCAILLKDLGILESIKFVHPKDVQDGKVEVTANDILTNLPYAPECFRCFDHHESEEIRTSHLSAPNHILDSGADSAARVLLNHYGGLAAFPCISEEMMLAVDKADSARFTREDILNPQGWELLSFIMDPRSGLGRFREFRVSNYELMIAMIDYCKEHSIEETLQLPDVRERVELYLAHRDKSIDQIRRCTSVHGKLAVLDLRNEDVIYVGNRFMIYVLFPQCDISMHIIWGLGREKTVFAIGKSILDRGCRTHVGELVLGYGGGGHEAAGTCQIDNAAAESVKNELIHLIDADLPGVNRIAADSIPVIREPALV
jgi:nanoRNase/pAp phosphatase (c-di-AMP/oligoRNAs hydrolase)